MRHVESAALWTVVGLTATLWLIFMLTGCAQATGDRQRGGGGHGGAAGTGGGSGGDGSGGTGGGGTGGTGGPGLVIAPMDPVITVTSGMPTPTVQFSATLDGQSVMANW